jgi:sortase (surface protein transpeptidase)
LFNESSNPQNIPNNANIYNGTITIYNSDNSDVWWIGTYHSDYNNQISIIKDKGSLSSNTSNLIPNILSNGHCVSSNINLTITPIINNNNLSFKYTIPTIALNNIIGTLNNNDIQDITNFTGDLILTSYTEYNIVNATYGIGIPCGGNITEHITLTKNGNNYTASNVYSIEHSLIPYPIIANIANILQIPDLNLNFDYSVVVTLNNSTITYGSNTTPIWSGSINDWSISCLLKGTKIKTPYGFKNIENLKVGDTIISHRGNEVKIIKTNNWYIKWSNNLDPESRVYVLEKNGKKVYLSEYHKYMISNGEKISKKY